MDEASKLKKLKEAEANNNYDAPAGGRCLVLAVLGLGLLLALLVVPVVAIRMRGEEVAAVAIATYPAPVAVKEFVDTATARPSDTAVPTATSSPLPTSTPPATYTPAATYTPLATHTAVPSQTPLPTYTPPATWTAVPTDTPAAATGPAAGPVLSPPFAPALPPAATPPDSISTFEAAVIALLLTIVVFAVLLVAISLYLALQQRRPAAAPTPLLIEGDVTPIGVNPPTPEPAAHPVNLRRLSPPERRYRPAVAPVEPVALRLEPGGTGGGGETAVTVPFDRTRPPTPAERHYIRQRYQELQSLTAVCMDVYGVKGGGPAGTFTYVKAAVYEGREVAYAMT